MTTTLSLLKEKVKKINCSMEKTEGLTLQTQLKEFAIAANGVFSELGLEITFADKIHKGDNDDFRLHFRFEFHDFKNETNSLFTLFQEVFDNVEGMLWIDSFGISSYLEENIMGLENDEYFVFVAYLFERFLELLILNDIRNADEVDFLYPLSNKLHRSWDDAEANDITNFADSLQKHLHDSYVFVNEHLSSHSKMDSNYGYMDKENTLFISKKQETHNGLIKEKIYLENLFVFLEEWQPKNPYLLKRCGYSTYAHLKEETEWFVIRLEVGNWFNLILSIGEKEVYWNLKDVKGVFPTSNLDTKEKFFNQMDELLEELSLHELLARPQ